MEAWKRGLDKLIGRQWKGNPGSPENQVEQVKVYSEGTGKPDEASMGKIDKSGT